ncbi:uncharacterized protein PHALS_15428 [Plasmopara halstedii]|uniref:RxLR-like protein n=1 Tax=Plasmopara halstedii TaxID=4781 RepID=A0A0P1AG70_PLAHL|nr:uncharacterized protein PHALS_15428 [Plasmopara halstedii]CEG40152.1 hypothetical protein PHALS_15428 [Plasmopara halstedii]|eukprot:XP_024576521.1 hypothetical protein PHALS_15428 [Plasmopara halstedii]
MAVITAWIFSLFFLVFSVLKSALPWQLNQQAHIAELIEFVLHFDLTSFSVEKREGKKISLDTPD